jgi:hypothetical protein
MIPVYHDRGTKRRFVICPACQAKINLLSGDRLAQHRSEFDANKACVTSGMTINEAAEHRKDEDE